jgi:PKD repeat protein
VVLTATNSNGSDTRTRVNYITVDPEPDPATVAVFVGAPTSGFVPLNVNFSDLSSNGPTSWSWSFGDGASSTAQNPSHTYNAAGVYTVSLTATNSGGSDTLTRSGYIPVAPDPGSPPVADFDGLPPSGTAPRTVDFTDLSSNGPTSWSWDFGDGTGSSAQNPSHTYTDPGVYNVSLTVSNAAGGDTQTLPGYITVDPSAGGPPFSDAFESGDFVVGGWVTDNNDAKVHSKGALTGSFGVWMRRTTSIEVGVDTSGRSGVRLSYARAVDRFGGSDRFIAEWFDGSSWNLVESIGDTAPGTTSVLLGVQADDNPALRIRFRTNSDSKRGQASHHDVVVEAN